MNYGHALSLDPPPPPKKQAITQLLFSKFKRGLNEHKPRCMLAVCSHINLDKGYSVWLDPSSPGLWVAKKCVGVLPKGFCWIYMHTPRIRSMHACTPAHTHTHMHTVGASQILSAVSSLRYKRHFVFSWSEVTFGIPNAKWFVYQVIWLNGTVKYFKIQTKNWKPGDNNVFSWEKIAMLRCVPDVMFRYSE